MTTKHESHCWKNVIVEMNLNTLLEIELGPSLQAAIQSCTLCSSAVIPDVTTWKALQGGLAQVMTHFAS